MAFSVVVFTLPSGEDPFGDFPSLEEAEVALRERLALSGLERSGSVWFERGPHGALEPIARILPAPVRP